MTTTAAPVLDLRAADPGKEGQWVHLVPKGRFSGIDGRGPYHADDLPAIIAVSMQRATSRGIPFDYDHQIHLAPKNGGTAPAAGWITQLTARDDGIWGWVTWTPKARAAIADHEYRFVSPVFAHDVGGAVLAITHASLTNDPNLGQLTALNARETPMDIDAFVAALREALGLDATADHAAMIAAVKTLTTARHSAENPDPARFVPMAVFETTVAELNGKALEGLTAQHAEFVVDRAIEKRTLPPSLRDWAIALASRDAKAFEEFAGKVGPHVSTFLGGLTVPDPKMRAMMARDARERDTRVSTDEVARRLGLTDDDIKTYGGNRP